MHLVARTGGGAIGNEPSTSSVRPLLHKNNRLDQESGRYSVSPWNTRDLIHVSPSEQSSKVGAEGDLLPPTSGIQTYRMSPLSGPLPGWLDLPRPLGTLPRFDAEMLVCTCYLLLRRVPSHTSSGPGIDLLYLKHVQAVHTTALPCFAEGISGRNPVPQISHPLEGRTIF